MKRLVWVSGLGALTWGLWACGGAGDSTDSLRSASNPVTSTNAATVAGTAGTASTPSRNSFGNSSTAAPTTPTNRQPGVDGGAGPDQGGCGSLEVTPMIHMVQTTKMVTTPGNLLIVFDKSLSMNENWSGSGSKWQAATSAITQAVTALQNDIAMAGAIFFPWADFPDACGVDPITGGNQIGWMPGPSFVPAWSSWIGSHNPGGFTPTDAAAQQADAALTAELPMLTGTTAVVFITDGDPTCGTPNASTAVQLVGQWLGKHMVKTYVVGLPGTSQNGQQVLTSLATAGGTMTYTSPNDPMALQNLLSQIVSSSVMTTSMTTTSFDSCMITLPMKPPNPNDVKLLVTEMGVKQQVPRDLGASGGWTVSADGTEIVLQGLFCDFAKMGKYEKISAAFGCIDYPPLQPPKVQ